MISRVLVPMDNSEMAEEALRFALDSYPEASVTVLHIVGEPSPMLGKAMSIALSDDPESTAKEIASPVVEAATEIAAEFDREIETKIEMGHPSRAILNKAADYDTVVVGAHGGSLSDRLLVGNVADRVCRRSPVPVTTVR